MLYQRLAYLLSSALCVGLLATSASAKTTVRIDGGPSGAAAKRQVVEAVDAMGPALAVCWRQTELKSVEVEVRVTAKGSPKDDLATPVSGGPPAQFAAGLLAVFDLPRFSKSYRAVLEIPIRLDNRTAQVRADLKKKRSALDACYDDAVKKDPSIGGRARLRFYVSPHGGIHSAIVSRSTLGSEDVERCLASAVAALKVRSDANAREMIMTLDLEYENRGKTSRPDTSSAAPNLQPKKTGPLSGSAISQVMKRRGPEFSACYDKYAKKKPKLAGVVTLRFTVRDNGTVRNVKIRDTTLKHAKVEACLVKVGTSLKFPGESGRAVTKVWYPFAFRRK